MGNMNTAAAWIPHGLFIISLYFKCTSLPLQERNLCDSNRCLILISCIMMSPSKKAKRMHLNGVSAQFCSTD